MSLVIQLSLVVLDISWMALYSFNAVDCKSFEGQCPFVLVDGWRFSKFTTARTESTIGFVDELVVQ
jgi:hypothetical protein